MSLPTPDALCKNNMLSVGCTKWLRPDWLSRGKGRKIKETK